MKAWIMDNLNFKYTQNVYTMGYRLLESHISTFKVSGCSVDLR